MKLFNKITMVLVVLFAIAMLPSAAAYHETYDNPVVKISSHQPYAKYYQKAQVYGYNGRGNYAVNYNYYHNNYRNYPNTYNRYTYPVRSYGGYGYGGYGGYSRYGYGGYGGYSRYGYGGYSRYGYGGYGYRPYASGLGVYAPYYPTLYGYAYQAPVRIGPYYAGSYYGLI